jgi:hypothetical protein
MRRTPCAICAQRGQCSSKTDFKGFTIMPLPRYGRRQTRTVVMPTNDGLAMVAQVMSAMAEGGYKVTAHQVYVGTGNNTRVTVARVGCDGARVEVTFPNVTAVRMADMHAASRCEIRPMMLPAKATKERTLRAVREAHRNRGVGCLAVCSTSEDAVALINEVAKRAFGSST